MTINEMKSTVWTVISNFFQEGEVYFVEQKMVRPAEPYVTLRFDNFRRSMFSVDSLETNSSTTKSVQDNTMQCELDLNVYSQGKKSGDVYINTVMGDTQDLVDYMESSEILNWMETNNVYIQMVDGSLRDLSFLEDVQYRYRANITFRIYFVSETTGKYRMGGKTVPNASGGGRSTQTSEVDDWFNTAIITQQEVNSGE